MSCVFILMDFTLLFFLSVYLFYYIKNIQVIPQNLQTNCATKTEWKNGDLTSDLHTAIRYVSPLFTSRIVKGSNNFLPGSSSHRPQWSRKRTNVRWQSASWISHWEENKNSKWQRTASYEYHDDDIAGCRKFSFVQDTCKTRCTWHDFVPLE